MSLPVVPGCPLVKSPADVCPHLLEGVLDAVARKWSVLIVGTLANHGRLRYTEIQRRLGRISPKTLAARLRGLERAGLVARTVHAEVPPRVEYRLTAAGEEFWRSAMPLVAWAVRRDHVSAPTRIVNLATLATYAYVAARYPDVPGTRITRRRAEAYLDAARRIMRWVGRQMV